MFAIPTNRLVLPAARSILMEMTSLKNRGIDPEELIIIDNGPSHVVATNKKDVEALQRTTSIPIIHHDIHDQLQCLHYWRGIAKLANYELIHLSERMGSSLIALTIRSFIRSRKFFDNFASALILPFLHGVLEALLINFS